MIDQDRMISENIGPVYACVRRFKTRGVEYEDLFQVGCMGLVKAIDRFEEECRLRFSTYAVPVILGEMRRLFRDGGSIKVGRSFKELSLKATRATAEFNRIHGRTPAIGELAAEFGVEITEATQTVNASQQPLSLTVVEDEGGGQIDVPVEAPDERISELLSLQRVVGELEPRDRSIIVYRYLESQTQAQTAQALGTTQVQVSRREKVILRSLREKLLE